MYDLSVIIPARNEMFLNKTVEEVLGKMRGHTECIVILDGYWPEIPLPQHKHLTVLHHPISVGQRAAINEGARVSKSQYIMKLDAHCILDEGYDVKLIEAAKKLGRETVQVPLQYNLHAFDWVCPDGHRRYQSPSGDCVGSKEKPVVCGKPTHREIIWERRDSRRTFAWRFDQDLHFQYWRDYEKEHPEDFVETMSILGACFFLDREWYWELGGSDEEHGSWGQQGTEISCKAWLSGGKVICNKKTWFSHLFRTQGSDFGFPYPLTFEATEKARKHSQDMWRNGRWSKAKYSLDWLVNKFNPPGWDKLTKGIVYYTDSQLDEKIAEPCREQLKESGLPVVSVSLKPLDMGLNIVLPLERGPVTMFKQILAGLEASTADIIFFCESDVLYHPSHFEFVPLRKDTFYYNTNVWKVRYPDGHSLYVDNLQQTSGLCAYRTLLLDHYRRRVERCERGGFDPRMGYEPGTHSREERIDDYKAASWKSKEPLVDIRHDKNLTASRWKKEQFRNQKYTQGWTEGSMPAWAGGIL